MTRPAVAATGERGGDPCGTVPMFDVGPRVVGRARCPRCRDTAVELHLIDGHHVYGQHDAIYGGHAMRCYTAGKRVCDLRTVYTGADRCACEGPS